SGLISLGTWMPVIAALLFFYAFPDFRVRGHPLRTVRPLDKPKISCFDSNCNHKTATKSNQV
ncbi:MAG: hypothetical protein RSB04_06975, partial [Gordonibacter sp.]|uniref:hypothetical protein n=1 Tax=Gordonibacter sp. TaxID=1968902 RepID=UPI002FCAC3FC